MIKENITLIKIKASEGMILTNGDVYGREIFLGKGDSPENWHEITEAEYEQIEEERKKKNELLPDNWYEITVEEAEKIQEERNKEYE